MGLDDHNSDENGLQIDFKLRHNPGNDFPGHVLFHKSNLPKVDLVEVLGLSGRMVVLTPIYHEKVQQNEIWVDKFVKDNYFPHDKSISYRQVIDKPIATLVEVGIRDFYISRIDMLMLKAELNHKCILEQQKTYLYSLRDPRTSGNPCQIQINHIFNATGQRMKKGAIITDQTRFAFRSGTGLFHILIQVSKEMFDWDAYGYMQYQRATNGFLTNLFERWKKENCCHDTQIIFFARHLYPIENMVHKDDPKRNFPQKWHNQIKRTDEEYVFIDFYRTIYVPSRINDEAATIVQKCREIIINWVDTAKIQFENGDKAPLQKRSQYLGSDNYPGFDISSAANGNFLQTLNMSLHIFERHQTDRSLHRTGQMIISITAGVGVFDVDYRNMSDKYNGIRNIGAKDKAECLKINMENRIRDLGVGCDLICLGEQPLHAVPLFRIIISGGDKYEYEKPDFINLNYYRESPITIDESMANIKYVPRIGFTRIQKGSALARSNSMPVTSNCDRDEKLESTKPPQTVDEMDEYDSKIFASKNSRRNRQPSKASVGMNSHDQSNYRMIYDREHISHSLTDFPRHQIVDSIRNTEHTRKRTSSNDSISRSERRPLRPNPNHKHRSRYLDSPVGSYESPPMIRGYSDYTSKPQNIPVRSPGRTHRDIRGRDKGIRMAGNSLSESFGYPKVSNFFSTSGTKSQTGKNPTIVELFISFMLCTKKYSFYSPRRSLQINQPLGAIFRYRESKASDWPTL